MIAPVPAPVLPFQRLGQRQTGRQRLPVPQRCAPNASPAAAIRSSTGEVYCRRLVGHRETLHFTRDRYVARVAENPTERRWAVCVYCASGPTHPELLALAGNVGAAIADRDWTLVSGGGNVSAMGTLANAARSRNGRTVGVIPKALVHRELADVDADELVVTDTMRERKQVMEDRADAFLVLPGGIGTLDEFFEAWTAGYLGMHDKPLVMLDPFGHYDGLLAWVRGLVDSGYVAPGALDRLVVVDELDAAINRVRPGGGRAERRVGTRA